MACCDCGCNPCWEQTAAHPPCPYECVEMAPRPPAARKVLGGKPGREILHID